MPLIRRCPFCKSTNLGERRITGGRHNHGGFFYAVACIDCDQILDYFDVIEEETGEMVASVPGEEGNEHRCVRWRKEYREDKGRLGGRDEEGMAI